ncbi:GntR family transcriptional regulator [Variovorax sp. UC122_21]|uniref:GntR family transcriptional regulator n=1 Tax=Variovorax sp. UC122_21 TaxID=3374554 RepID=UPI0037577E69
MTKKHDQDTDVSASTAVVAKTREKAATLSQEVQETLEDLIVSGALKPGERLDEAELARRFQISRTPLREAFKALAGNGLVEMRGQRGTFVSVISMPVLIEMFQVMSVMEGLCAKYAARRANVKQRQQMRGIHERLSELLSHGDHERFYEVNREFHDALYAASNTSYLSDQTRALRRRVTVYRRHVTFQPGRMAATIGEHLAIIDAIERNDPEAAFAAAADHVTLLQDDMVDLIATLAASTPPDNA